VLTTQCNGSNDFGLGFGKKESVGDINQFGGVVRVFRSVGEVEEQPAGRKTFNQRLFLRFEQGHWRA